MVQNYVVLLSLGYSPQDGSSSIVTGICRFVNFLTYINDLQTLKFFIVFNQEWITLLCEDSCTKVFPNKLFRNIS